MRVVVQGFWLPKAGNTQEEYEDAFYPRGPLDDYQSGIRLAVADGATETSFSRLWADLLARSYVGAQIGDGDLLQDLEPLRQEWREHVQQKPLPWYAEAKLKSGAFAALAGLNIRPGGSGGGAWDAVAVGDCCVFQIRENDVLDRFPLERAEDFSSRPALIPSNDKQQLEVDVARKEGLWQPGDTFFLMTDAIACYFLRRWEGISTPGQADDPSEFLKLFHDVVVEDEFARYVEAERGERLQDGTPLLRNDDVTFLRCLVLIK